MYDLLFLVPSPPPPSPTPEFLKVPGWLALEWLQLPLLSVVVASASSSPTTLPSPPFPLLLEGLTVFQIRYCVEYKYTKCGTSLFYI